jgi:hypothetical protein
VWCSIRTEGIARIIACSNAAATYTARVVRGTVHIYHKAVVTRLTCREFSALLSVEYGFRVTHKENAPSLCLLPEVIICRVTRHIYINLFFKFSLLFFFFAILVSIFYSFPNRWFYNSHEFGYCRGCSSLIKRGRFGNYVLLHSKGFWRWCVTLIITKLLDFVHRPDFYAPENTTFRKLYLFPKRCVFWFVEIRTLDKVQKFSTFCYSLLRLSRMSWCVTEDQATNRAIHRVHLYLLDFAE